MSITVELPEELARYCQDEKSLELAAATISEALDGLWKKFPELQSRVLNQQGQVRSHLLLLHNRRQVILADQHTTAVVDGDVLEIIPLASGG